MTSELDTYIPPSGQELEQTWQLASKLARTEFVPGPLRGKPEAVLACMLTGRELGIGPMQALRDIYVINGRPALSATLMVTRVRAHGHRFRTITSSELQATVQVHRHGETEPELPVTFTFEDAKRAKLVGKDVWQQYPKAMLWARAASAACRRDCPEALGGAVYTPEEIENSNGETTTTWGRELAEKSDPPSQPTPPGRDAGGSDPMSGMGATGASSQPVPDQTSEAGEREGAPDRHDPASDSTSPGPVRGRQDPGTSTSPPEVRSTRGTLGGDHMSGVGSRHAPAGDSREGDPPAGSPTPDHSPSGLAARGVAQIVGPEGPLSRPEVPTSVSGGDAGAAAPVGKDPLSRDPMSPSADPIDAHEAQGTAGQGGDATSTPESSAGASSGAPDQPHVLLGESGARIGSGVDTNAGPVGQGEDGGSAGPAYPVEEWAIRQDPPVDLRVAKVALRKQFKEDFGWLKDWRDLQELQGEQASNAITALEAIYLDPGEGKG